MVSRIFFRIGGPKHTTHFHHESRTKSQPLPHNFLIGYVKILQVTVVVSGVGIRAPGQSWPAIYAQNRYFWIIFVNCLSVPYIDKSDSLPAFCMRYLLGRYFLSYHIDFVWKCDWLRSRRRCDVTFFRCPVEWKSNIQQPLCGCDEQTLCECN